jgi:hypothetical protein
MAEWRGFGLTAGPEQPLPLRVSHPMSGYDHGAMGAKRWAVPVVISRRLKRLEPKKHGDGHENDLASLDDL